MNKTYRNWVGAGGLVTFTVCEKETDLLISLDIKTGLPPTCRPPAGEAGRGRARQGCLPQNSENLNKRALTSVIRYRQEIESYIRKRKEFLKSLSPVDTEEGVPPIIKDMISESCKAGVGPMATVAGAIAQYVGEDLLSESSEIIVENGGDIFLKASSKRTVAIYAGDSIFTQQIAMEIEPEETPLGICTSSGTVGHSLSFGKADAVVIYSPSAILADAVATAACNLVKSHSDIEKAVDFARSINGVRGVAVIFGDKLGIWGKIRLKER